MRETGAVVVVVVVVAVAVLHYSALAAGSECVGAREFPEMIGQGPDSMPVEVEDIVYNTG